MDSTSEEMGPTKGAVLAFLDFLVEPLLPARSTSREAIAHSQEVLVAKQVHAVVVLYNYHYRKQHPDMEFLDFQSFCKLAVALKPSLQLYFKIMKRTDAELEHLENLSLTEKAIMNACDTSKSLDASSNYPIIEGWPVAKVAVFLIDYKKENCYLFHGSITQGVWSAIEKEVNGSSQGSEVSIKKKRVIKKASKENQTADGTGHQQLAYLAVKDTCGINQCDLKILETHLVYSTSKPKTAVRLFIMQCTQTNQHENLVPINDVMDSLQGPLVRKDSVSWIFTPVVEYFHLLPFADKVSDCLIREMSQDPVQHVEVEKDNGNCKGFLTRPEQLSNPSPMPKNSSQYVKAAKDDENCKDFHTRPKQPSNPMPQKSSQHVEVAKDDGYHKSFHIRPEQPSNPSHMPQNSSHVEVAKVGGHCKSSHIRPEQPSNPSHMPQSSSHVEVAKDGRIYKSSNIKPEQPSNPSHITQNSSHVEVAKDGGNCTSSHIRPEQLSNPSCMPRNSSHVGVAKDGGNCTSSHSRPEQLSIPSHMPHNSSQNVKEAKDDGKFISSHIRPEQLSNHLHMPQTASQHVEAAKDGGNRKSFHIRPEQLSNPSHHIAANKIENCSGSPSMLETLLNNSAKNRTLLQVEKEPSVNTSEQSCTLLNKKPLLIVPESLEAKETQEVRSGNSDHLKEGAAPSVDTHQLEEPRHPEVGEVVINSSSRRKWLPVEPVVYRKRNKVQKNNSSNKISRSNLINASTDSPSLAQEQCVATPLSLEKDTIAQGTDQTAVAESAIVVADIPVTSSNECDVEKNLSDNRIVDTVMLNQDEKQDHALVPFDADFKHLRKIQLTIASKEKLLSHTALNVLIRKREQLSLQVRNIEDEMALCDRSIQTILSGSEDDLAVKIDSVLEGCNEICLKSSGAAGEKTALHFEDQDMPLVARRKRLSEANVSAPSPCQELDRICNSNYWILPTYNLSASKGGFLASVTVKGVDFECSSDGKMHMNPHEARNSAASNVLAKLRGMASES